MRSLVRMGDECPNGKDVFQMTFAVGPKASGTLPLVDTPDPFGPLNRDQSSPDRALAPAAAATNTAATSESRPTTVDLQYSHHGVVAPSGRLRWMSCAISFSRSAGVTGPLQQCGLPLPYMKKPS